MLSISSDKLLLYRNIAIFLLCSVGSVKSQNSTRDTAQTLELKIYYESLCGESERFISEELSNAMVRKKLYKYADIKFIPYGKSMMWYDSVTGDERISCQHGYQECELNALHACIIEHNSEKEQFEMIACLLRGRGLTVCAKRTKTDVSAAKKCKSSRSIADILRKYATETKAINLQDVPSIAVDGFLNPAEQNALLYNFASEFCRNYENKYNVTLNECSKQAFAWNNSKRKGLFDISTLGNSMLKQLTCLQDEVKIRSLKLCLLEAIVYLLYLMVAD